jgi:hypothetical protein
MVPSDLSNKRSFLPACTVEAVQSGASDVLPPCSPSRTFARVGSTLEGAPSRLSPNRNPLLETAFRSSEKTVRFRTPFPESMLLACPFGSPRKSSPNSFGLPLIHAFRLAPDGANSNTADPLSGSLLHDLDFSSNPHFRSGLFDPSRSKRWLDYQPRGSPISKRPIARRSPLPAVFNSPATDQCFGLATLRSAYCLTNLLEPSSLCSQSLFRSIENSLFRHTFAQNCRSMK